ncbi:MAG TPA: choice-of-anchor tandem repeat GloVer-containing protein [Rhizomicrobium sp.]|nr:choice-of-anchor tandem repeat GloVer-containing protein [Rhizomicrobium sp.]
MKRFFIAALAGIVSCAFVQVVSAADAAKFTEKVVYSFCSQQNCADGSIPAYLIDAKGTLYGTTRLGGHPGCGGEGCGTVFSLDPGTGAEAVIYSFCIRQNCADGYDPRDLIDAKGTLYGTTGAGGGSGCVFSEGCGTVFSLDPGTGAETVLHAFGRRDRGKQPVAVTAVNGKLFGVAVGAGETSCRCGIIFSMNRDTGAERVLHSFSGGTDGAYPLGGLIAVDGTLYGTTESGGMEGTGCIKKGCGTLFSFDPSMGTETVLYAFRGGTDGALPWSALIDVNGVLYGTTSLGGSDRSACCGTVFSFDLSTGVERVLYSFCSQPNCADGEEPYAALIDVNGKLYGTTDEGGGDTNLCSSGCGTVFSLDPDTGRETVIYAFCSQQNCTDGAYPENDAPLVAMKGTLYGETSVGGAYGYGTVFALTKQ